LAQIITLGAPLRCAPAYGSAEGFLYVLFPALIPQRDVVRFGNVPGYCQASLAGLDLNGPLQSDAAEGCESE